REVAAAAGRPQVSASRGHAASLENRPLSGTVAFGSGPIEVCGAGESLCLHGLQEGGRHAIWTLDMSNAHRAAMAVIGRIRIVVVVLRTKEIGDPPPIAPTGISSRRQTIEIAGVTAEITHPVDGSGATDRVPAGNRNRAMRRVALRPGHEPPV